MEALLSAKAEIEAAVDEALDSLPHARYNTRMLQVLCQRIAALKGLQPTMLTKVLEDSNQEFLDSLKDAAVQALALVKGHARPFQIGTYYKVDYVQHRVKTLCETANTCLFVLGIDNVCGDTHGGTDIDAACALDQQCMRQYLTCILDGRDAEPGMGLSEGGLQELRGLIEEHRHRMRFVSRIQEKDIVVEEHIGDGGYGDVVKARWLEVPVAVKKMRKELSPEARAEFFHEVEVHIQLNHPNVVRCYGATTSYAIVMELALANLEQFSLYDASEWTWGQKVQLMLDACKGLTHLHESGVVHRDVKTSNFLVFRSQTENPYVVKICDFGLSAVKAEKTRSRTGRPCQGTKLWMAPEVTDGAPHSFASDTFSFGLVLFEIATVASPYRGFGLAAKSRKKDGKDPCTIPASCPRALTELLRRCISPEPNQRPKMNEVGNELKAVQLELNAAEVGSQHC